MTTGDVETFVISLLLWDPRQTQTYYTLKVWERRLRLGSTQTDSLSSEEVGLRPRGTLSGLDRQEVCFAGVHKPKKEGLRVLGRGKDREEEPVPMSLVSYRETCSFSVWVQLGREQTLWDEGRPKSFS